MPTVKEITKLMIDECKVEGLRILNQSGLTMSFEVLTNRKIWETCIVPKLGIEDQDWEMRGIQKINQTSTNAGGWVETGDGLYRYTILVKK